MAENIIAMVRTICGPGVINYTTLKQKLEYIEMYSRESVGCQDRMMVYHFDRRAQDAINKFWLDYKGDSDVLTLLLLFRDAVQAEEKEAQEEDARIEAEK